MEPASIVSSEGTLGEALVDSRSLVESDGGARTAVVSPTSEATTTTTLTQLANRYGSDKGDVVGCCHRYAEFYEELFTPLREAPISLLEIGLQREVCQEQRDCPSLRLWLDYFPRASVYGLDLADFAGIELPRTRIFRGDQSDRCDLQRVAEECQSLDIVIDDGSHASADQQLTLGVLFPKVKPGGFYIIEDTHWQPQRKRERKQGISTTQEVLERFAFRGLGLQSSFLSEQECGYLESHIERCIFSHPMPSRMANAGRGQAVRKMLSTLRGRPRAAERVFKLIILQKRRHASSEGCRSVDVVSL